MKNKALSILRIIVYPISFLCPFKLIVLFQKAMWVLYSVWVAPAFCKMDGIIKMSLQLHGGKYISIGRGTVIGKGATLEAWDSFNGERYSPAIDIGDSCTIKDNVHITAINRITIGNGVLFGPNVLVTDNAHGASIMGNTSLKPSIRPLFSKGPIVIKENVWVGQNVCVLPGVTIGKGSIIGANSVVIMDVPDYAVVCGNPARVVKIMS